MARPGHDDAARAVPTSVLDEQYRVERTIGEGTFGRVYLATDTRLRRPVAIKELLATRNTTDPDTFARYQDRFGREARAGGAISHPHVVTVYEMEGDADGNTYLVMEYIDGTDLRALLAQIGTLPTDRVVSVSLDVARALEAVHEQDIVHRDLKPANIMLTRKGVAKLTDFGIAQVGSESMRTQMIVGHPGTPLYMSPEQASGFGYIDGRSDLYSLGLVMYEMLTGEPFGRRRVPLAQRRPDLSAALITIVDRLLQRDPDARYGSASEVVTDLARLTAAPSAASGTYTLPVPPPGAFLPSPGSGVPPAGYGSQPGAGYVPSDYAPGSGQPAPPSVQYPPQAYPYAPQQPPPPATPPNFPPYGGGGGGGQPPYGTQSPPPQRRRSPYLFIGIGAGVLVGLLTLLAIIGAVAGGSTATPTPGGTPIAAATTAPTTPTAALAPTAAPSGVSGATPTAVGSTGTTAPGVTPVASVAFTVPTRPPATRTVPAAIAASAPTTAPFPIGATVQLAPGNPLPVAMLPHVFVDANARYTLHYPAAWNELPGDADTDVQWQLNGITAASVTTENLGLQKKPTAQQLADQVTASFGKQLTNYKLSDATQIKVAGQDGVRMLYTFTDSTNNVAVSGYLVAFSTDSTAVLFSGIATNDQFDALLPTFDAIAGSLTGGAMLTNTYTDPQGRFLYSYPRDWQEAKPANSSQLGRTASPNGTASFNIVINNDIGTATLQQYYDAQLKTLSDPQKGFRQFKKVIETNTDVDGTDAKLLVYTADVGDGILRELHQWYIVYEGQGFVLTFSVPADKAREFADMGDIIADNFSFG